MENETDGETSSESDDFNEIDLDQNYSNLVDITEESSSDEENPVPSDLDGLKAELVQNEKCFDKFKRKQNKVNSVQKAKLTALQNLSKKQSIKLRKLKKLENASSQQNEIIKQLQDFQTRQEQVNEEQKNEIKQLMESNENLKKENSDQKAKNSQLWEEFKTEQLAKLEQLKSQQDRTVLQLAKKYEYYEGQIKELQDSFKNQKKSSKEYQDGTDKKIKDLEAGIGGIVKIKVEPMDSNFIPNDSSTTNSSRATPPDYQDRDYREEQNYHRGTEITNEREVITTVHQLREGQNHHRETEITNERKKRRSSFPISFTSDEGTNN